MNPLNGFISTRASALLIALAALAAGVASAHADVRDQPPKAGDHMGDTTPVPLTECSQ
jgi:methionine-rich copper-binding protein CopC